LNNSDCDQANFNEIHENTSKNPVIEIGMATGYNTLNDEETKMALEIDQTTSISQIVLEANCWQEPNVLFRIR
jgi:hypothetical protein